MSQTCVIKARQKSTKFSNNSYKKEQKVMNKRCFCTQVKYEALISIKKIMIK